MEQNLIKKTNNEPEIIGFLRKLYNKEFINHTLNGKAVGNFQISFKNQDGSYTNYNCATWNLYIIDRLESWEGCKVTAVDYTTKDRIVKDKTYTDYTISTFDSVYRTAEAKPKLEQPPTINIDDLM